jgi:hypothetical protein
MYFQNKLHEILCTLLLIVMWLIRRGFGLETGFVSLKATTNYSKSSIVIAAPITPKTHSIFTLRELVFLPTSRLPWPMPKVLVSSDLSSIFSYLGHSLCCISLTKSLCKSNCRSLELRKLGSYGRIAKEISISKLSVRLFCDFALA